MTTDSLIKSTDSLRTVLRTVYSSSLNLFYRFTDSYGQFYKKDLPMRKLTKTHSLGNCFSFWRKLSVTVRTRFNSNSKTVRNSTDRGFGC
jgi:hypothetical protein